MAEIWQQVGSVPLICEFPYIGKAVILNQSEYLIPTGTANDSLDSLFLYNIRTDAFSTFMKFRDGLSCNINSAAIDIQSEMIYIPGTSGIVQIDLRSITWSYSSYKEYSNSLSTTIKDQRLYILHSKHTEDEHCCSALSVYDIAAAQSKLNPKATATNI